MLGGFSSTRIADPLITSTSWRTRATNVTAAVIEWKARDRVTR